MTATLPDNMTARVCVPGSGTAGIVIKVDGVNITGTEQGNYTYVDNIGSGVHTFERAVTANN